MKLIGQQTPEKIFTFSLVLGLGISLIFAIAQAQANHYQRWARPSDAPWCSQSYRASSYALGLGSAFSLPWQVKIAHFFDNGCHTLGKNGGTAIRAQHASEASACDGAFKTGMRKGLEIENSQFSSRYADCEQAGYSFGEALLAENARAGLSTAVCNHAYRRGYADGKEDRVPQSYGNGKEDFCYSIGFDDGAWFGR